MMRKYLFNEGVKYLVRIVNEIDSHKFPLFCNCSNGRTTFLILAVVAFGRVAHS